MFWHYVAYVCIVDIDACKVHCHTNYSQKSTVEETGYFTWAMFGEDDTSIMSTIMFKTRTES